MTSKIVEKIKDNFILLVSIPKNDLNLALAAQRGGADGIKMHINVNHYASGTSFGTWEEEKANIDKILKEVKIPVGILPGATNIATKEEILNAKKMGIDFIDSFAHNMPIYLWEIEKLGKMIAVNQNYSKEQVKALEILGVDIFEATLLKQDEYGKPLNLRDLSLYYNLSHATNKPVIVPTQKKIVPREIPLLKKAGVSGIVIGAVVTGNTKESLYKTTKAFKDVIRQS